MKPILGMATSVALFTGIVATPQPSIPPTWSLKPAVVLAQSRAIGNQANQRPIAKLSAVSGKVTIKSYSQDPNWRTANRNLMLYHGDLLKVSPGSSATIECLNNPALRRIVPSDGVPWGVASACPSAR